MFGRGVSGPMRRLGSLLVAFAVSLLVTACSLFPGASLSPHQEALRRLAVQQALWQSSAIDDYTLTLEEMCFCPRSVYEITVADGLVTQVTRDGVAMKPADIARLPKTVPELFGLVAGLAPNTLLKLEYDPDFGFPSAIGVDPVPNAVDDEYAIEVRDFSPAS